MAIATAQDLKQLQTRLAKSAARQKSLKDEVASLENQLRECNTEIKELNKRIDAISKQRLEPVLTEHALLRYLERVKGVDLKAIHEEILTPEVKHQIGVIGSGSFTQNGYRLIVKQGIVITIENVGERQ